MKDPTKKEGNFKVVKASTNSEYVNEEQKAIKMNAALKILIKSKKARSNPS